MSNLEEQQELQKALSLQQGGRLDQAADLYRRIVRKNPKNYYALHYLGIIEAIFGNYEEAKALMDRSLSIQPPRAEFAENYATILFQMADYKSALEVARRGLRLSHANVPLLYVGAIALFRLERLEESVAQFDKLLLLAPNHIAAINERGSVLAEMKKYDDALVSFEKALTFQPQYAEAHLNKGNVLGALKRYDDALAAYDKALALKPGLAAAWAGRGNVLRELKRYDEALGVYDKALTLKPDLADAWLGRGNVFFDLKRYDDAFAAYDRALTLKPDLAKAWLGRGNVLVELKRYDEAFAAYDRALTLKPDLAAAWLGRGNVFFDLKRYDETFAAYDRALALEPDLAAAWLGRGNVLSDLKRYDDAFAAYDRALTLEPDLAEAWFGRGNVSFDLKRYDDAFAGYEKALSLKPDLKYAEGIRLHAKLMLCDWTSVDAEILHLLSAIRERRLACPPFGILSIPSSPADQLLCARSYILDNPVFKPIWRDEVYSHDRIRVAYLSADFHEHAVAYQTIGLFEHHDKSRFETTAISFGSGQHSPMRHRIKGAFEHFLDVQDKSDQEIAELICRLEIDIAVDLMGLTKDSRLNVLGRRPAPIQVNYLGYLGTMGAEFIDYVIADKIALPFAQQPFYSEKIIHLPDCFLATDDRLEVARWTPSREEVGLPPDGFVFCSFNNSYKIGRPMFELWMRLLRAVEGSVLWLLESNAEMVFNLRREAQRCGVDHGRIIFAPRMALSEHLARQRLADLFLDTIPYNAGATAAAALWSGVPMLTVIGETLVGRMATSMLRAVGMPELVTYNLEGYQSLAVKLAGDPALLSATRRKLQENLRLTPLFDTDRFRRHIEQAYMTMVDIWRRGERPRSFGVETA